MQTRQFELVMKQTRSTTRHLNTGHRLIINKLHYMYHSLKDWIGLDCAVFYVPANTV